MTAQLSSSCSALNLSLYPGLSDWIFEFAAVCPFSWWPRASSESYTRSSASHRIQLSPPGFLPPFPWTFSARSFVFLSVLSFWWWRRAASSESCTRSSASLREALVQVGTWIELRFQPFFQAPQVAVALNFGYKILNFAAALFGFLLAALLRSSLVLFGFIPYSFASQQLCVIRLSSVQHLRPAVLTPVTLMTMTSSNQQTFRQIQECDAEIAALHQRMANLRRLREITSPSILESEFDAHRRQFPVLTGAHQSSHEKEISQEPQQRQVQTFGHEERLAPSGYFGLPPQGQLWGPMVRRANPMPLQDRTPPLWNMLGSEEEIPRTPWPPSDFGILPAAQQQGAGVQDGGVFMQPSTSSSFGMAPVQRQQDPPSRDDVASNKEFEAAAEVKKIHEKMFPRIVMGLKEFDTSRTSSSAPFSSSTSSTRCFPMASSSSSSSPAVPSTAKPLNIRSCFRLASFPRRPRFRPHHGRPRRRRLRRPGGESPTEGRFGFAGKSHHRVAHEVSQATFLILVLGNAFCLTSELLSRHEFRVKRLRA